CSQVWPSSNSFSSSASGQFRPISPSTHTSSPGSCRPTSEPELLAEPVEPLLLRVLDRVVPVGHPHQIGAVGPQGIQRVGEEVEQRLGDAVVGLPDDHADVIVPPRLPGRGDPPDRLPPAGAHMAAPPPHPPPH